MDATRTLGTILVLLAFAASAPTAQAGVVQVACDITDCSAPFMACPPGRIGAVCMADEGYICDVWIGFGPIPELCL